MDPRKFLLRTMLISLALTALGGVYAIMSSNSGIGGEIALTAVATAVASFLLLRATGFVESESMRRAGIIASCFIVFEYILAIVMTWVDHELLGGGERLFNLFVMTAGVGIVASAAAALAGRPDSRLAGRVGYMAAIALAYVDVMSTVMLENSYILSEKWMGTAFSVGGFGSLAALSLVGYESRKFLWQLPGVAISAAAAGLAMWGIWRSENHSGDTLLAILGSASLVSAHANLSLRCPLAKNQGWIPLVTIISLVSATAIFCFAVSERTPNQDLMRPMGALLVVAGCGTVGLIILARINGPLSGGAAWGPVSDIRFVEMQCPRCKKGQSVPLGAAACGSCGLTIKVQVELPEGETVESA